MQQQQHIRCIHRPDIDVSKWDECIRTAGNSLIYATSHFLDIMTDGRWDALVSGDYAAVMPLTWRKKMGFTYLYQPFFMAGLGIFGKTITPEITAAFLKAIPRHFSYWDFDLNEANSIQNAGLIPHLQIIPRINYLLSLDRPYDIIHDQYKRLARRMLKKAAGSGLSIVRDAAPADVIGLYRQAYRKKHTGIDDDSYQRLARYAGIARQAGQAAAYLATDSTNRPCAFYLVFSDDHFIYSVLGGSTTEGKKLGAFYLLTDAVIRDHAGTNKKFRFEGSDIERIAFFNQLFGPQPVQYPHLVMNRLPFPLNILKG